jgi:hypothetical protein
MYIYATASDFVLDHYDEAPAALDDDMVLLLLMRI